MAEPVSFFALVFLVTTSRPAWYPTSMSKQSFANTGIQIGSQTRRAVVSSLRLTAISILVTLGLAAVLAGVLVGVPGLQTVGLCAVAGLLLLGITVGSHRFVLRAPDLMMVGMGADFVLKLLLFLGLVAVARQFPIVHPLVLFLTMLALILVQAVVFSVSLLRLRVPLVEAPERET